jgi:D-glycero-alpha-D-manno-heptose-7-phosphate kinase
MLKGYKMIIVRSPLRITFGGGGTDILSYADRFGGFCVSAAINKYVYISINRTFIEQIFLKYSELEKVKIADEIKHPIFREAIKFAGFNTPQIEISSIADIPAGTGLGSSGAFTCALLKALYCHKKKMLLPSELAELACFIEIEKLNQPIGKQDQYISAYGGITSLTFNQDRSVEATHINLKPRVLFDLEDNLSLFFTGYSHLSEYILLDQTIKTKENDAEMIENLDKVKEYGYLSKKYLEEGKLRDFGELLSEQWERKKERSPQMSNTKINEYYDWGMKNGAIGGKLIGAGGGGFLLFYSENNFGLRKAMERIGLEEVRFHFDFEGTTVVY